MIISHFELIFKPQSPNAPTGTAAVDNLIQGYFLEITNLSEQTIKYALTLKTASVSQSNRSLAGNALVIVDKPDQDNTFGRLNGITTATSFTPSTGLIEIEPDETALVAILPSAFGAIPGIDTSPLTTPDFEVRGVVELTVPSLSSGSGTTVSLFTTPQATDPVDTLVTPQNRTTYFKADGTISDQTQASLPVSSGGALISIKPEPRKIIRPDIFDPGKFGDVFTQLRLNNDVSSAEMLAGLLATVEPKASELTALNKAMADQGIGFAIERRKVKLPETTE